MVMICYVIVRRCCIYIHIYLFYLKFFCLILDLFQKQKKIHQKSQRRKQEKREEKKG